MRLSASQLCLAYQCAWAFRNDVLVVDEAVGQAALDGTDFAELRANFIAPQKHQQPKNPSARALRLFDKWTKWWTLYKEEHPGFIWTTEIALAYNPKTGKGRLLRSHGHRDYSDALPDEIVGTADLVGTHAPDGYVIVLDDKTGAPDNVQPIKTNDQLRTLGTALASIYTTDTIETGLVFVSESGVDYKSANMDVLDLDCTHERLRGLLASVTNAEPVVGDHCRYCPARSMCPAFSSAASSVSDASALVFVSTDKLTTLNVAKAWPQIKLIEAGLEQIKQRIYNHVETHGDIPLFGGKHLRIVESSRNNLSQASIKRALGDDAQRVLNQLREAGAIETSTSKSLRETKS